MFALIAMLASFFLAMIIGKVSEKGTFPTYFFVAFFTALMVLFVLYYMFTMKPPAE